MTTNHERVIMSEEDCRTWAGTEVAVASPPGRSRYER